MGTRRSDFSASDFSAFGCFAALGLCAEHNTSADMVIDADRPLPRWYNTRLEAHPMNSKTSDSATVDQKAETLGIAPDLAADDEAIIEHLTAGTPIDPDVPRRVRERAERITEEVRQKHGVLDIGVPAIREVRQ
jgi:hypothetical protein